MQRLPIQMRFILMLVCVAMTSVLPVLAASSKPSRVSTGPAPPPRVLRMTDFFSDHMVLQRAPQTAAVWGWSTPGDVVRVTIAGQTVTATAAKDSGLWELRLKPVATGGPYSLLVSSTKVKESLQFNDVMFGDVFLCAGQSNMQFTVSMAFNAEAEVNDSVHYPLLRVYSTAISSANQTTEEMKSKAAPVSWAVSSPASIGGGQWSYTSAACYFFGRDLYRALGGKVPIGLVTSAVGGTCIEAWSSASVVDKCTTRPKSACGLSFSGLYNAMLHPLRRLALTAFVWYQGEQNSQDAGGYKCRLPLFIGDIRQKFNRADLPFLLVQLHAAHQTSFVGLRDSQALTAQQVAGVSLVVTIDLGDEKSPFGAIHPRHKQEVGARLSLVARRDLYADHAVEASGPVPVARAVRQNGDVWTYTINFSHGSKLYRRDTFDCVACCAGDSAFELLDSATKLWVAASVAQPTTAAVDAAADTQSLLVSAQLKGNATGVRYAWSAWPQCALYNSAQLPAAPFIFTDN